MTIRPPSYKQGLTTLGGTPTLNQIQKEVDDHLAWLFEIGGLIPDARLQEIVNAWNDGIDEWLLKGDIRREWPELADLLDALATESTE